MKRVILSTFVLFILLTACNRPQGMPTENVGERQAMPVIFPDYTEVTIPYNIAPLNFRIEGEKENVYVHVSGNITGETVVFEGKASIRFNEKKWKRLLAGNKGGWLTVAVYTEEKAAWNRWQPFRIYISDKAIDSHLAYRLIEPGYKKWHIMGLYQRDLTSFREKTIIRNDMVGYNCINCHSFCGGDPEQMMFHMRAANGGTYILQGGEIEKLYTKTDKTISHLTYPYWHPSGRYITASVNDIKQFFHAVKEKKIEVFDLESDVVVYDIAKREILSGASLITRDAFETFPSFSADGQWLYFCSAPAKKMPDHYAEVRYNLCRVAFDAEKGEIRMPVDTLVRADSLSASFPRISPNGRFMMYTETAYGQFPIWHTDAEIRMIDLENNQAVDMTALNSSDTESYHSWSSNSHWVVVSSRRDNGLYTLPYLCHIGVDGQPAKPFLMPQKDPDYYDHQLYSYNLPELIQGEITTSPYKIQRSALKDKAIPLH
ncbi:hypothetical protein [Parabacteroides sp. PF5-6]|uniref:TolB family protein n=1 Tax=Parabacteroides sp. PF5-6 TaxID=1742403 RepID=UPI0024058731|nr:hypothetical protein [Parabacteroides sp. PF5-6]MDF9830552.1 hypothetical protein [Parabacteroides sp. PF5-6]